MINLKVLGNVGADQKINTKEQYLIVDDSVWYQSALRIYRGDSRKNTIERLNSIIDECKILIDSALNAFSKSETPMTQYLNFTPKDFLKHMLPILQKVEKGLRNLIMTYNHDTTTTTQLELYNLTIMGCINEIMILMDNENEI